jgi:hypothetical protein
MIKADSIQAESQEYPIVHTGHRESPSPQALRYEMMVPLKGDITNDPDGLIVSKRNRELALKSLSQLDRKCRKINRFNKIQ